MSLSGDTVLKLAGAISIELRGDQVTAQYGEARVLAGPELFEVVRAFRQPTRLGDALVRLGSELAAHDLARVDELIARLVEAGVLRDDKRSSVPPAVMLDPQQGTAEEHVALLDDRTRTEAFVAAVRHGVRPDDVVVDLGTGTGILALAAAEAGARRVYAIEQGAIADAAARVFDRHERITLVRGCSTRIELPEKATLLVSEIIGDEPLAAHALEYFADAQRRLLASGARQIPKRLRIFARGVKLDEATRRSHRIDADAAARWSNWYQLDLGALARAEPGDGYRFLVTPEQARRYLSRTRDVLLASIDLARGPTLLEQRLHAEVTDSGGLDALLSWFELDVDDERTITSEPTRAAASCHWRCPVWLLPRGLAVRTGETVALHYRHDSAGTRLVIT
jgi:hypothetical protein